MAFSNSSINGLARHDWAALLPTLAFAGFLLTSLVFATGLIWERLGPPLAVTLSAESVGPYEGRAYSARIDRFPAFISHASRRGETRLILLEDGVPLPAPGANFDAVTAEGAGRYAASGRWLLFAPADNSDPSANGRRYEAHLFPGLPTRLMQGLAILAFLCGGVVVVTRLPGSTTGGAKAPAAAAAILAFSAVAFAWGLAVWEPSPQIVSTGDGGNVASIVAAKLHPERFAGDPVFGDPNNYAFYKTLLIPFTAALTNVTGDIGQAYMSLSGPLVLLQLIGFFLLGRRLFGGTLAPSLLALATIPPVFVFSGELWGMLGSPLTRSLYAALLPYLLMGALAPYSRIRALSLMTLCAAAIYIHPVSAPSVALGIVAMLFVAKPERESWLRHSVFIVFCGFAFLAIALPFALAFAAAFPGGGSGDEATAVAQHILRHNVGRQYYSVAFAVAEFVRHFWPGILAAAFAVYVLRQERDLIRILAFGAGVAAASIGVSALDQAAAAVLGRDPIQIDLIRNIRFLVPVALILIFWALAKLMHQRRIFCAPAAALAMGLWIALPTPIGTAVSERLLTRIHATHDWGMDAQAALRHLASLPPGAMILPLPHTAVSEGYELATLAIRYGALQRVAFQTKDMNFLAYSGSDGIVAWNDMRHRLDAVAAAPPLDAREQLGELLRDRGVTHILVYTSTRGGLREIALSMGTTIAVEGDFTVIAVQGY